MTVNEIMDFLKEKGNEQTKKIYSKHGAPENVYGVKVGDMKIVTKKIKVNHEIAMELYATGNGDAQYLAGLISDSSKMSKQDLQNWAKNATWYMVNEYAVAWATGDSEFGMELAKEWISSNDPHLQCTGYATLSAMASVISDEELDLTFFEAEVEKVGNTIHDAENRVRHVMNGFVIATGSFIPSLTEKCKAIGEKIGKVSVMMGETACKTPLITPYIQKVEDKGRLGKKRKAFRC